MSRNEYLRPFWHEAVDEFSEGQPPDVGGDGGLAGDPVPPHIHSGVAGLSYVGGREKIIRS